MNVRAIDLAKALAADAQDGLLDGKNAAGPIVIPKIGGGSVTLTAAMGTSALQVAIGAYVGSVINKTNLVSFNIASGPVQIGVNTSGMMYATTPVMPAWISGQGGSATLHATGGTPPYVCALKMGSPPAGIGLATNCVVLGTAPMLGSGITMSISPPFTVTINDAAGAHVDIELRITIVVARPTLIPVQGTLTVNQQGRTRIANANGGTGPLYFASDTFRNGAPPLGTIVNLNGELQGIIRTVGIFTFGVCVIDLIGAEDCGQSSVNVVAAAPPPPSSSTYYWANWSCGSSQCAGLMGGYSGSAGPMCTVNDCNAWGNKNIPAGYSCFHHANPHKKHWNPEEWRLLEEWR